MLDTTAPTVFITLNDIPDDMNDVVVVPPESFQITLSFDETPFDEALDFYKEQMPAAGWTFESETIAGSTALLNYTMGSTQISVVLTQPTPDDPVMVTIGGD